MTNTAKTREIQPTTTTSTSAEGRRLDEYVAYTSWAMRTLGRALTPDRRTA